MSTEEREHVPARDGLPARLGLRSFLERLLGWEDVPTIDGAMRSVARAVAKRAPLVLCGDGDLVPIARALHRHAFGPDRSFVLADPRRGDSPATVRAPVNYRSGVAAFAAATDGTLCVRSRRPPRDFAQVMKLFSDPGARVRLVVCADPYEMSDVFLAVSDPIRLPALETRERELPRIVEEYGEDARDALSTTAPFTEQDRDWVIARGAPSLHEIELATLRLVAIRHAGTVKRAAELLGMSHAALGEWFAKRRTKRGARRSRQPKGAARQDLERRMSEDAVLMMVRVFFAFARNGGSS